jgi:hypothetical protein
MAKFIPEQNSVTPSANALAEAAAQATSAKGLPPVHLWNPPFCGDLDMRIARDGTWFYQGTPIGRPALARLFSTILKREGGKYFLVTPAEKVGITVDDAPFVAVDFRTQGAGHKQTLIFVTNMGDEAVAGPAHPLRIERDPQTGAPAPYVMIRDGLEALIDRKSFYRLAEIAETAQHGGEAWLGLWSGDMFFPLIRANELG